jgi:RNA polymerase sigma-32 factor
MMGQMQDIDQSFLKLARRAPYLERDQEHYLAVSWKDTQNEEALHQLAAAHMRLVISVAQKFRHYGLSMADVIQEGHIGLLEAASRFDPHRDIRFSTYATWWVRASIQDYVLRNWSIVRCGSSSSQKALFFNLRRLRARLTRNNHHQGSEELYAKIATTLGVSMRDVASMDARLSAPDTSMNAPLYQDEESQGGEYGDTFRDEAPLPDEYAEMSIDGDRRLAWLRSALSVLSEREMNIVRERRLKDEQVTLESLGERLGISKERVRQIESRAMEKLKQALLQHQPRMAQGVAH